MEVTIYAKITYIISRTISTRYGLPPKRFVWCSLVRGKRNSAKYIFYNWVTRFRKKDCEIPPPTSKENFLPVPHQDVVRVDLVPDVPFVDVTPKSPVTLPKFNNTSCLRLELGDAKLDIPNDVNPELLVSVFRFLRGASWQKPTILTYISI